MRARWTGAGNRRSVPGVMLGDLLTAELFSTFLVFTRIGACFVTLPTIGETFVNPRTRLTIAVLVAVIVAPVVEPLLPEMPERLGDLGLLLLGEAVIGAFIGVVTRILFNTLSIAGVVWSFLSGLASSLLFNPLLEDQGALQSVFFTLLGLLLLFATDMHHLLIRAAVESYTLFEAGQAPMLGDMADVVARTTADAFRIAIQITAPVMVVAMMFYTLLGLLARLMPQMQVFFVAMPLQILIGMFIIFVAIGGMMMWFLERYREMLGMFLQTPG